MKMLLKRGLLGSLLFFVSCVEEPTVWPNTWQGNFESLWNIIDTRYCYLDYKTINWDSIKVEYQAQVDTVSDQYSFFNIMSKMLGELKDGHVNLSSDFDKSRYWDWFLKYPSNFDPIIIYDSRYLGMDYKISGGMRYAKIAQNRVGYIYLESFSSSMTSDNVNQIFLYFANCDGLIIDVRNNGGGVLNNAETLATYFFEEKTLTGYMSHKTGDGHSSFSKPEEIYTMKHPTIHWDKTVVVLTNRMSYSATNVFACRMHYAPHATIIGDKTGGGGGLPMANEMPIGWSVRFSASPIFDAEMNQIEWGLYPDIRLDLLESDAQNRFDTYIERAVQQILTNN